MLCASLWVGLWGTGNSISGKCRCMSQSSNKWGSVLGSQPGQEFPQPLKVKSMLTEVFFFFSLKWLQVFFNGAIQPSAGFSG